MLVLARTHFCKISLVFASRLPDIKIHYVKQGMVMVPTHLLTLGELALMALLSAMFVLLGPRVIGSMNWG